MSATPIIEAIGLHTYYGSSHILHGIDFTVRPGETVSLLGRNGMGKTTALRSILGLTRPRRGAWRDGSSPASPSRWDRRRPGTTRRGHAPCWQRPAALWTWARAAASDSPSCWRASGE